MSEEQDCAICLEPKTNPLIIQCAHSFCSTCLCTLIRGGRTPKCPLCRGEITYMIHDGHLPPDEAAFVRSFNTQHAGAQNWIQEERFLITRHFSTPFLLTGLFILLYLISPWDFIPDSVPVLGFVDDATMIIFFLALWHFIAVKIRERREQ